MITRIAHYLATEHGVRIEGSITEWSEGRRYKVLVTASDRSGLRAFEHACDDLVAAHVAYDEAIDRYETEAGLGS